MQLYKAHGTFLLEADGLRLYVATSNCSGDLLDHLPRDEKVGVALSPLSDGAFTVVRCTAKDTLLALIASRGLATRTPKPVVSVLLEIVSGIAAPAAAIIRSVASHEEIEVAAYFRSLNVRGPSAFDAWLAAEDEILHRGYEAESHWI